MEQFKMVKSTLLLKLFISFIFLTTIPLIIIGAVSDKALLKYTEEELTKSFIKNLEVSEQVFGMWNDEVCKQAISIAASGDVKAINGCREYTKIMTDQAYFTAASNIIKQLEQALFLNAKYSSITLSLTGLDYIVTSQGGVILKDDYIETQWLDEYSKVKPEERRAVWRLTPSLAVRKETISGREYALSYVYPIAPYTTEASGFVVTNIRETALSALINGGNAGNAVNDNSVFIINDMGDMVSNIDKSLLGTNCAEQEYFKLISKSNEQTSSFKVNEGGKDYLLTYFKSEINDWIYVSRYSVDALTSQMLMQRRKTIGVILLLVAVTVLLSYMISKRIYSPIRKLTNKISSYQKSPNSRNEIVVLSDAFETIITQVEKSKTDSLEGNLIKLLSGLSDSDDEFALKKFSHRYFCCAVLSFDRCNDIEVTKLKDYQARLLSSTKKLTSEFCICEGVHLNADEIAFIFNFDEAFYDKLLHSLTTVQSNFLSETGASVSIGIGSTQKSCDELNKSYKQAGQALQRRLLLGYNCISVYEEKATENENYFYPAEFENSIDNNFRLGNHEQVAATIHTLVQEIKSSRHISPDNVMQIFNQLTGIAIKYLIEIHVNTQKIFYGHANLYQELAKRETIDDIEAFVLSVYKAIIDYVGLNANSENDRVRKIQEYIHEHYHHDIELSVLAEHVGLSVSHMRRIFTEETGENILYYINNLRIDEAKKLLSGSQTGITEIAYQVGYFNKQSFNRFFKKYEGITPSEYRAAAKKPADTNH